MDKTPLNKAHQLNRRAEFLLKQGKFDEALSCHQSIIEQLTESMCLTENERSLESLKLQKEYHEKQTDTIQKRKQQYENCKSMDNNDEKTNSNLENTVGEPLTEMIFRKIEEHDSLIVHLVKRSNNSDSESMKSSDTDEKNLAFDHIDMTNNAIVGCKLPKGDGTTIEELNILSGQLKNLVCQLINQLEDRNKEIEQLKAKIKLLESEKIKAQSKNNNSLRVVTDSSGGTSPYVFSPCSELSPDVVETRALPTLAPLEMPSFQFYHGVQNK